MISGTFFSALAVVMLITGCRERRKPAHTNYPSKAVTELYNDSSGFCIKAQIPEGWLDNKEILSFLDENFIFQNVKSTKDGSSWMVLQIYEYKSEAPGQFNVDSLLPWHIKEARVENKTMNVLDRHTQKRSSGKTLGYYDSTVGSDKDSLIYSRVLIFKQGKKISILSLHSKGNQDSFQKIANLVTTSLDY